MLVLLFQLIPLRSSSLDILPIQVELQFDVVEARNWRGTYGQFIDPSSTMQSPKVTLTLPPSQTASDDALYTILLNDLGMYSSFADFDDIVSSLS